jgi:inhibitor of KinA sporulation pathway (predicted exonuclease)
MHCCDVLVVLDIEATCDQGPGVVFTDEQQEIIEFPWLLFDIATGEIISAKRNFVRPKGGPLPKFCVELTGITDEQLSTASSLAQVLHQVRTSHIHTIFQVEMTPSSMRKQQRLSNAEFVGVS